MCRKGRVPVATKTLVLLAALLAGCTVGPDFKHPEAFSPESWFAGHPAPVAAERSVPVAEPIDPSWWALFNDAELTRLVTLAGTQNLDVRIATIRLAESRAQRASAASKLFPTLDGNASYTREKPSAAGIFSAFGGSGPSSAAGFASGAGAGTSANGAGAGPGGIGGVSIAPLDLYQAGFDASWELDLWGKVRRSIESADATIDASAEARRDTLLNSIAELVRDYVQLRGTQADIAITRENTETARQTLRLTQSRADSGLTTGLDVTSARAQVSAIEAVLPQLEQQEAKLINAIGLLLGEPPGVLRAALITAAPVPPVPPRVPVGLPAELARRRPDIREAEARLHGATADIGVAVASFFPSVTLSGSVGLQSLQPKNFFSMAAGQYAFGPGLTVPIFEGGQLRATLTLRKAQQQEAAVTYQKVVLQALGEVDDALSAYADEQRRRDRLAASARDSESALGLSRDLYGRGLTDFLKVLDAQRTFLSARQQLADSGTTLSTNLVALYKALGGGWEVQFPERSAAR
jgi:NodT family efflux transporter outer membrane factor (OMF) lipoprotein